MVSSFPFLATSLLERQCNHTREWGNVVKLLLVKLIRLLIANARVAALVIVVVIGLTQLKSYLLVIIVLPKKQTLL